MELLYICLKEPWKNYWDSKGAVKQESLGSSALGTCSGSWPA